MQTTTGVSPKAKLAAALVGTVGTLLGLLIARALPNDPELAGATTGVLLAAIAFAGAYIGKPGAITETVASDDLLPDDVKAKLAASE